MLWVPFSLKMNVLWGWGLSLQILCQVHGSGLTTRRVFDKGQNQSTSPQEFIQSTFLFQLSIKPYGTDKGSTQSVWGRLVRMKQKNQLSVKLKINLSASRERGDQEIVGRGWNVNQPLKNEAMSWDGEDGEGERGWTCTSLWGKKMGSPPVQYSTCIVIPLHHRGWEF